LSGLVQQKLGYVYLLKGDRDQAAQAYAAVLQIPGALNRDHALFELARLEESQSRPEGALNHYQELIKSYSNSPLASEAAVRMKALDVKKPAEAPPASSTAPATSAPSGPAPKP
jgi:tetratricopeptide (TPR) repeat protein